jgi:hypothetical protein
MLLLIKIINKKNKYFVGWKKYGDYMELMVQLNNNLLIKQLGNM